MTDPQTAADAAERVQRWRDAWMANLNDNHVIMAWLGGGARGSAPNDCPELTIADVDALLDGYARMAAELEQVRGERAAAQPPIVAELMRLTPEQLSVRRCAWCSPNPTMAGLWCLCIAACGNADCKHDAAETDAPAAGAAPDATGGTQTREQRADGLRDLTKLEGSQRGSQGDAALCLAGIPQEIADRAGLSRDALCALPAGHADPTHDDGHGLSWQGLPVPPGTSGACCSPIRRCTCCGGRR